MSETTPTSTLSLSTWLEGCLAADEATALAALGPPAYDHYGDTAAEECWRMAKAEGCSADGYRFHRTNDPAATLRRVAAHRKILALHEGSFGVCAGDCDGQQVHPCPTLRALAGVYVGAEGWREEWT